MAAGKIVQFRPANKPQRITRTVVDTIAVTPEMVRGWQTPPFQRPLKVNAKVLALAAQIREDGGVIPGILTLGVLGDKTYKVDGQHRCEAFLLSEMGEGFVDIRKHFFESMADMGDEFVLLNSSLVRLKPDDILRGREGSTPGLAKIRKAHPWVGYDMIRRGDKSPIVSMSTLLRCWFGSATEVPATGGMSASDLASTITGDDADAIVAFADIAIASWGRDGEYARLWSTLNLSLCMWLYRRTVIAQYSPRTPKLTREQYGKCLMSLSANSQYLDYLVGRQLRDRDRAPAFNRVKAIFAKRIEDETKRKPSLPAPAWAHGTGPK